MHEPIQVGDRVWMPTPLRAQQPMMLPGVDHQALALEEDVTKDPGEVFSIGHDGWALVDLGTWGRHGCHVSELRRVNDEPTSMQFFGVASEWDAPVTEGRRFGLAPVGRPCAGDCDDPIGPRDTGVYIPQLNADGTAEMSAWHRRCFLRNVLGPDADELFKAGA